jgi:hypothetical protein
MYVPTVGVWQFDRIGHLTLKLGKLLRVGGREGVSFNVGFGPHETIEGS